MVNHPTLACTHHHHPWAGRGFWAWVWVPPTKFGGVQLINAPTDKRVGFRADKFTVDKMLEKNQILPIFYPPHRLVPTPGSQKKIKTIFKATYNPRPTRGGGGCTHPPSTTRGWSLFRSGRWEKWGYHNFDRCQFPGPSSLNFNEGSLKRLKMAG